MSTEPQTAEQNTPQIGYAEYSPAPAKCPAPAAPVPTDPSTYHCGQSWRTPFCAVCGSRLTDNPDIGPPGPVLERDVEDARNSLRLAQSTVDRLVRKHEEEMNNPKVHLDMCQKRVRQLLEARDYAEEHNL